MKPKFGEIYLAELKRDGFVQGGNRPVIVVSNNTANKHSPVIEIIPLTSKCKSLHLPVHPIIKTDEKNGLLCDSVALAEQVRTVNVGQLLRRIGEASHAVLVAIGRARAIQSPLPLD